MNGGSTIPVALLCVCIVLAGCQTVFTDPEQDGPAEPTTLEPLRKPANHPGLTANLQIVVSTDDRVRITVTEQSNRGTVYNETFAERTYVSFGDGQVFRENGAYRVEIRVNGTVQWDRTVKHSTSYDLRVAENGSVLIESFSIA